jgi:hypothetical protein
MKPQKIVNNQLIDLTDDEIAEFNKQPSTEEKKTNIKSEAIRSRMSYLLSTDWYVNREIDQSNSYPQEIKDKRIQARQEINDIEAATTLTALYKFNIYFEE